jgi:hypothetical protein
MEGLLLNQHKELRKRRILLNCSRSFSSYLTDNTIPICPKKVIVYEYAVWAKCGVFVLNTVVHIVTAGL